ncbi:hypothetical protein EVAR_22640_1 [Eumeta japonica]|uniref:Uncharacterized protein n=1 Tax=Eumeta variegata TaxID=151549 RepID=A0A4C1VJR8_EUMVA|nr:hypothetical protein EVAR_22640_1 [Eumeta japonica]
MVHDRVDEWIGEWPNPWIGEWPDGWTVEGRSNTYASHQRVGGHRHPRTPASSRVTRVLPVSGRDRICDEGATGLMGLGMA